MPLTRDQILQAASVATTVQVVQLPGDLGTVCLRTMSGAERLRCEELVSAKDARHTMAIVPAFCLCDESGVRLFSDEEIPLLDEQSSVFLNEVNKAAGRLNKLAPRDVEEAGKNS